jgi:hypothetical protein
VSRLRQFFVDHLAYPILYAIPAAVFMTGILFVMVWAGFRGRFKPWGDPIPFMEALASVPKMLAFSFVLAVAIFTLARFRFPGHGRD